MASPRPGTAVIAGAGLHEALENAVQRLGGNPDPGIDDLETDRDRVVLVGCGWRSRDPRRHDH